MGINAEIYLNRIYEVDFSFCPGLIKEERKKIYLTFLSFCYPRKCGEIWEYFLYGGTYIRKNSGKS